MQHKDNNDGSAQQERYHEYIRRKTKELNDGMDQQQEGSDSTGEECECGGDCGCSKDD